MAINLISITLALFGSAMVVVSLFLLLGKVAALFSGLPIGLLATLPMIGVALMVGAVWIKMAERC